ncbi:MAG: HDOD domain-containing protein [Planctomycetes bacterium]|nr:HDOD domain-containing protein [Planctomycetota bacterium]
MNSSADKNKSQVKASIRKDDDSANLEHKEKIFREIKRTQKLPSPDKTALDIFRLSSDRNVDYNKLRKIVEKDPAIASRVMQLANSAFYRSQVRIYSLKSAFVRLGMKMLGNVALGVSLVSQNKKGPCAAFDYEGFWSESVARSVSCWYMADDKANMIDTDIAFTAGLMCQVGRLAFASVYPAKYTMVLRASAASGAAGLLEREQDVFGMDHNELGAKMMADWNLPDFFCRAVQYHDKLSDRNNLPVDTRERSLARLLQWSKAISMIMTKKQIPTRKALDITLKATSLFGMHHSEFPKSFDLISSEWVKMGSIFEVATREVPPWDKIFSQAG